MAVKTPGTRQEQDESYNPSQQRYDEDFNRPSASQLQELENYANTGDINKRGDEDETETPSRNIDNAKEKESEGAGWVSNVGGERGGTQQVTGKTKGRKKRGPLAFILALVFGGAGAFSIILGPGIGIVHMKELFAEDLNDQLAATTIRSDHMLRAKLKGIQAAGVCSDNIKIRCKFSTMSKRQIRHFRDAGFKVETETTRLGRQRVVAMSYTVPEGAPNAGRTTTINNPQDLTNAASSDVQVRSALRRAFNPVFFGTSDGVASRVFRGLFTDKTQKVAGATDEQREEAINNAVSGVDADLDTPRGVQTDEDGREYIEDDEGNKVYASGEGANPEEFNRLREEHERLYGSISDQADAARTGGSAAGNFFKSFGKGLSVIGAADTACTVYNTARAVSAAAKATRAIQLAQFAMVIFNTADMIKAGEATPENVAFVGTMLASVDTRKTVVDEQSIKGSADGQLITEARANPNYGKNAYDSAGYKTAAYNDAPTLSAEASRYMVGGALSGTLSKVIDAISERLGGRENIRSTCKVVQSWWARTAGLVAGIVSAVGSFGTSTVVTISVSVAIGFAMPFLQAALADIIAGKTVSADTKGPDAGNATFSGAGVLFGKLAQNRGMSPANKDQIEKYQLTAANIEADYVAMETYEARNTPFDITNQYSFLGSMARTMAPATLNSTASVSGALLNVPSLLGTAFSSVIPHANAVGVFNPERFSKCEDEGYRELGIDADIFCNPRYYMSGRALNMPTEEALDWMLNNGHIDDEGEPKSDEYKDWIKNCAERQDGWGETSEDEPSDPDAAIGLDCLKEEFKNRNTYFAVYYMDLGINNGMDDESTASAAPQATGTWANPAGSNTYQITSPFGPRSSGMHDGIDLAYKGKFYSACDGTIKSIGNNGDRNGATTNIITIDCGKGITTKYMHYFYSDLADISVGDIVSSGTELGITNNQGNSTGTHLHFQIEINGTPRDPARFMERQGVQL